MEWQMILTLVIAIPIILFPVAFVWYINIGGVYSLIKEALRKRAEARQETAEGTVKETVKKTW